MSRFLDLTGKRFGRWTVIGFAGNDRRNYSTWECVCDCGGKKIVARNSLRNGNSQSCGCLQKERLGDASRTHGMTDSPTWTTWHGMKTRCLNPKTDTYPNYGGRGIKICERWMVFENFLADMGERPDGLTLERKNNDGNYEPGNCYWATKFDQSNNKRNNRKITFNGKTLNLTEWARTIGVSKNCLWERFKIGWSVERALQTPVKYQHGQS